MVEVFKTNVTDPVKADMIIKKIHRTFKHYSANFDLEDSDKILRIECDNNNINIPLLLDFLQESEVDAKVLEDDFDLIFKEQALNKLTLTFNL